MGLSPAQPIAIDDLLAYLTKSLFLPITGSRIYEIGGADPCLGPDYARIRSSTGDAHSHDPSAGADAVFIEPVVSLVTPLYARIGRKLIESIVHSTVVRDKSALETFDIRPVGVDEAVRKALAREDKQFAATRWSDALSSSGEHSRVWRRTVWNASCRFKNSVRRTIACSCLLPIERIGGDSGWYAWNWLWRVRGFIDLVLGGIGVRRGRSGADVLRVGDTIDFWRVERFEPNHLLRLVAEMKLPGRAWLEFEVTGDDSASTIRQTAIFDPVGLFGRLYWYALYPFHQLIFGGMLRRIVVAALHNQSQQLDTTPRGDIPNLLNIC